MCSFLKMEIHESLERVEWALPDHLVLWAESFLVLEADCGNGCPKGTIELREGSDVV